MFTGIVQGLATVSQLDRKAQFLTLTIAFPEGALEGVEIGASIAINGVCLTVTGFDSQTARFDVIDETLEKTTLGRLMVSDSVNFERAARFGSEIGGHLLSGHISDTVNIVSRNQTADNCAVVIQLSPNWLPYVLAKGYVAVDGISLTVGTVDEAAGTFSVHLIPETLSRTTLGFRQAGDALNLEIDAMTQAVVETVRRVLAKT